LSIATPHTVPDRPQNIKLEMVSKTAVSLSWAPPDSPNGVILEYEVFYYGYKPEKDEKVMKYCGIYCSVIHY